MITEDERPGPDSGPSEAELEAQRDALRGGTDFSDTTQAEEDAFLAGDATAVVDNDEGTVTVVDDAEAAEESEPE